MLRAEPAVFGPVASDPTVSRLVDALAAAGPRALAAIRQARSEVRQRVWKLAGKAAPNAGGEVIVDLDGVLVLAHSEKQDAPATWKKTSATTRWSRSSTTAAKARANRLWACCGPGTRAATPPATTSPSPVSRSPAPEAAPARTADADPHRLRGRNP